MDFVELEKFNIDCPVAGGFIFVPYILESGILDLLQKCKLPESSDIGSLQACLMDLQSKAVSLFSAQYPDFYSSDYIILDNLESDNTKFITLRKRSASLIDKALELPKEEWQKVYVPIPKRKHKRVSVNESEVWLKDCGNTLRQIIEKDYIHLYTHYCGRCQMAEGLC